MVLESIGASHFAEKARWILDRARVPYTEVRPHTPPPPAWLQLIT